MNGVIMCEKMYAEVRLLRRAHEDARVLADSEGRVASAMVSSRWRLLWWRLLWWRLPRRCPPPRSSALLKPAVAPVVVLVHLRWRLRLWTALGACLAAAPSP